MSKGWPSSLRSIQSCRASSRFVKQDLPVLKPCWLWLNRSSDHCTVSVTSSFTPPPPIPPTQRHLWHFENARRADMSNFLLDFPWNDYCFRTRDPDLAATAVGEVVDSGNEGIHSILFNNFFSL